MKTPTKSTEITNVYTLEQIFSIPLRAVVEANANAAGTAIAIIRKYGFVQSDSSISNENNTGGWGELRYVTFIYNFSEQSVVKTMTMNIPLLSLIPIPLLQVKSAVFNFGVKILNANESSASHSSQQESNSGDLIMQTYKKVNAMLVPSNNSQNATTRQASLTANIDVQIEMVQSDLPAGILNLINLQQQAAHGQSSEVYKLVAETTTIDFSPTNKEAEVIVSIKFAANNHAVSEEKIVIFEINKDEDFPEAKYIFTIPPKIILGQEIGKSTTTKTKVLSVDNGRVGIQLKPVITTSAHNGLIKISTANAPTIVIYYFYRPF